MTNTARRRGLMRALAVTTSRETLLALAVLVVHVGLVFVYLARTETAVQSTRQLLYPVVWVVLSVYLVAAFRRRGPNPTRSRVAVGVAVGYFLLLAAVGSTIGVGDGTTGTTLVWASPGWGPIVLYSAGPVEGALVPFELIGYLALSWGVASAVAASSRGVFAGLVGVFTCIGCVLPVVAAVVGLFGGTAAAAQPATTSYGLATAVFAATIVLFLVAVPTTPAGGWRSD
ncbi:MAG: DUF7546 family protein [Natrialbaceae archaeon]